MNEFDGPCSWGCGVTMEEGTTNPSMCEGKFGRDIGYQICCICMVTCDDQFHQDCESPECLVDDLCPQCEAKAIADKSLVQMMECCTEIKRGELAKYLARRGARGPRASQGKPLKGFRIEYAKSNRAGCKGCQQKIEKNELRLGKLVRSPHFDGYQPLWHHVPCYFKKKKVDMPDVADIEGFFEIKFDDQKLIKDLLSGQSSAQPQTGLGGVPPKKSPKKKSPATKAMAVKKTAPRKAPAAKKTVSKKTIESKTGTTGTKTTGTWYVASVIDKRGSGAKLEYKIHWEGYPSSDDTWRKVSQIVLTAVL